MHFHAHAVRYAHLPSLLCKLAAIYSASYALSCTPATALPLGSSMFFQASSYSKAFAVEQAMLASWGTVRAAVSLGNRLAKISR